MRPGPRRLLALSLTCAALPIGYALTAAPPPAAARAAHAHAPAAPPAASFATAAHVARVFTLVTRRGDTLTSAALLTCGRRSFWPELWWANRHTLANPNLLPAGTVLTVPACGPTRRAHLQAALNAIPPPPPPPAPPAAPAAGPAPAAPYAQAAPPPATGTVSAASGYEACVIAAESGGNPGAVNPSSGAGGLYQFLPSTWASLGYSGSPQDADPATQQQAFDQLYAQAGSGPWSSDGC